MKRYMIERNITDVGAMSARDLREAAGASCSALDKIGTAIQWQHSYVAGNKTFCVYLAKDEETIHAHARQSGFPADIITEIPTIIDPITSQA